MKIGLFRATVRLVSCLCLVGVGTVCGSTRDAVRAPVLLISMDGFRWDYVQRHPEAAPHMRELMRTGVSAEALIPVYPTNTFPNHYSIVTGLYPSHNGIVNNRMFDPELGMIFGYNKSASASDGRWWRGEPIWITAVKQGRVSACSFWPGSEAEIDGHRPTFWKRFDYSIPFEKRLDELRGWLALPEEKRPAVITFYLEETNGYGHRYGPNAPETVGAIQLLDTHLGRIIEAARKMGQELNVVIVSDHGMTATAQERVLLLDDYVSLDAVQVDFDETSVGLRPAPGHTVDEIMAALEKLPRGAKAYRASELPAHFHVDPSEPRVPPIWIVPEEGWHVVRGSWWRQFRATLYRGQHGYDPALPSMRGILVAHGPAFRDDGAVIPAVENVHIYNLLCAVAGLYPASNDGDDRLVRAMLRDGGDAH